MANIVTELRNAGFDVLTRDQWGARYESVYQQRRKSRTFKGKAQAFFAHVTVTNPSGDFAADVRIVEEIGFDRFQSGISYNYIVNQKTGQIAIGQPHDAAGTHTINDKNIPSFPAGDPPNTLNYFGHAIAWIGNIGDAPSRECKDAYSAIMAVERKLDIATGNAPLLPHSMFAFKECPLLVMTRALPDIASRARTILEDDVTKEELKEAMVDVLASDAGQTWIRKAVWQSGDVFPNQKQKDVSHNTVMAKLWTFLTK